MRSTKTLPASLATGAEPAASSESRSSLWRHTNGAGASFIGSWQRWNVSPPTSFPRAGSLRQRSSSSATHRVRRRRGTRFSSSSRPVRSWRWRNWTDHISTSRHRCAPSPSTSLPRAARWVPTTCAPARTSPDREASGIRWATRRSFRSITTSRRPTTRASRAITSRWARRWPMQTASAGPIAWRSGIRDTARVGRSTQSC